MSPGSIAETIYGRQGGGWAPTPAATPDLTDEQRKRKDPADRWCARCLELDRRVKIADHPTEICQACGGHACHHPEGDAALCWEGRARMAAAKRATGAELNHVEVKALARHPDPPMLSTAGYQLPGFWKKHTG